MNRKPCDITLFLDTSFSCELEKGHKGEHRAIGYISMLDADTGKTTEIKYLLKWKETEKAEG